MSGVAGAARAWQRTPGVLVRHTPRSMVMSVPAAAEPVVVEGAAVAVWEQLSSPSSDADIAARIAVALDVAVAEVTDNLVPALIALADLGAISAVDG